MPGTTYIYSMKHISDSKKQILSSAAVLLLSALVIQQNSLVRDGVSQGIAVCTGSVIPSLFPMLILSAFLTSAGLPQPLCGLLFFPIKKLTGVSADAAECFLFGSTAGYPVGVKTSAALFRKNQLSKPSATRAALLNVNPGVAFSVLTVGKQFFGNTVIGLSLFTSVTLSNLAAGILLNLIMPLQERPVKKEDAGSTVYSAALITAVESSVRSLVSISAWIVAFSAFTAPLQAVINTPILISLLEVTNAAQTCARHGNCALCAFSLGFGGFCVFLQLLPELKTLGITAAKYLGVRVFAGLCACIIEIAILRIFRLSSAVFSPANTEFRISRSSLVGSISIFFLSAVFILSLYAPYKGRKNEFRKDCSCYKSNNMIN